MKMPSKETRITIK